MSGSMTTAHRGIRLNARDLAALSRIVEGRVATLETVQLYLYVHDRGAGCLEGKRTLRSVRYVVNRWVRAGLVSTERNPFGGNTLVVAQKPAMELVDAPTGMRAGLPSMGILRHSVAVQRVGAELMVRGYEWTHEVRLPWNDGHRPDGCANRLEENFAVEVDLTRKQRDRWIAIAHSNVARYNFVAYHTTHNLAPTLQRWVADAHLHRVCRVSTLPSHISLEAPSWRGGENPHAE